MRRDIVNVGRLTGPVAVVLCCAAALMSGAAEPKKGEPTTIKMGNYYNPNAPEEATTKRLIQMMREDPSIRLEQGTGLAIPGGGKASLMMSIAGNTAPDVGNSWFHIIRSEIDNGFMYPLNEWVGYDKNGNGQIDDNEATWEPWKKIPPLWRRVATVDGKVYGIPEPVKSTQGLIFRTDLVASAGLNPNKPPQTWDELIYWCQKLTDPNKTIPGAIVQEGQKGIGIATSGWQWLPWVQSQGGEPIVQIRKSPKTGQKHVFGMDASVFVTPDGEDLSREPSTWQASFMSPEGRRACELLHKLRWMKWLLDPQTGEPVNLTEADARNHFVMVGERKLEFTDKDVIKGVGRAGGTRRGQGVFDLLGSGEVAICFASVNDLVGAGNNANIDPSLLSWFPYPAGPGERGKRRVQVQDHYIVMYEGVKHRPKEDRDKIWKVVAALADTQTRDNAIRDQVLCGLTRFANPADLERLGYDEYIKDIPLAIRQNFKDIETGAVGVATEPWMGFWFTMDMALSRKVFTIITGVNGENFDYLDALEKVETAANSGVMFAVPRETIDRARPYARAIFGLIILLVGGFVFLIIRSQVRRNRSKKSVRNVYSSPLAWGLVLPAVLLIAIWSYYPLIRGMIMAFQEYKITGVSKFVGLENFIILGLDKSFWKSLVTTSYFVFLNMTLSFCAPIVLAILLTEVPRFKLFFRTLFFLPQMTSGMVVALLWKLMYNPTPQGFINQLVAYLNYIPFVHVESQTWLENPNLAMICCIIPSVWAGMGMGSLLYLAALRSIPPDLYEAAEIDGAGFRQKLFKITLPTLLPLIIISFVGAFIGTFQSMGNIFLLTFGGPGDATMVVGLKIWIEAYNNLRFSMATSMAWVLGSLLIGFTYLQIQMLGKVEYRKAQE
jgi:multiple sugar transport system permease protein